MASRCAPASASVPRDKKQASLPTISVGQQEERLHLRCYALLCFRCLAGVWEPVSHLLLPDHRWCVLHQVRTVRCAAASVAEPQVASAPADTFPTAAARQAAFTEDILPDQVSQMIYVQL